MKYFGSKSQISLKTIKQNLLGTTLNNYYSLNISRNKKKNEIFPLTKRDNQLLYKSNISNKTKFSFHKKNEYKIHYYTIKINFSNSEEKNKTSKYPFTNNKKSNFLRQFRNPLSFKKKINNNKLSVEKLVDLLSERKLKYLKPIENNLSKSLKSTKKLMKDYSFKEKGYKIFERERIFVKDLLKNKKFNHLSFTKLNRFNSLDYKNTNKENNDGIFFQNEQIRKVLRSPISENKSMEIYSIFFHNKKH